MHSVHPPLLLDLQVSLEVEQQIGRRHCATSEEVRRHPSALKVVGSILVRKDVHEELATFLQCSCALCHQLFVILHVLKHLGVCVSRAIVTYMVIKLHTSMETILSKLSFLNS